MNAPEILARLQSLGAVVTLSPAGFINLDLPKDPEADRLVAEIRSRRAEVVAELRRRPVCIDCGAHVPGADLLCDVCHQARKETRDQQVADLAEDRRSRLVERLASQRCSACGSAGWHVNPRGDSWCSVCFPTGGAR